MPNYLFQHDDGTTVEKFFPVEDRPHIGDEVEIEGRKATRVAHFHLDAAGIARKTHQYPYVSNSLPSTIRGVEYTKTGKRKKPIIRSQAHEREIMARYDYEKD